MSSWKRFVTVVSFTIILLHLVTLYVLAPDPRGSVCLGCFIVSLEKLIVFAVVVLLGCLYLVHRVLAKQSLPKLLNHVSAFVGYLAVASQVTVSLIIVRAF